MPPRDAVLQTKDNDYYFFKQDVLADQITYSTAKKVASNLEVITSERAREVIEMNKNGEKPLSLSSDGRPKDSDRPKDMLDGSDLTRFDKAKKKKKKKKKQQPQNEGK